MQIERAGDGADVLEALRNLDPALQEERFKDPGYHVSGLLRDIQERSGKNKYGKGIDDTTRLRWEAGFTWELALERAFAVLAVQKLGPEIVRPPPILLPVPGIPSPIVCSPDGLDELEAVIHEIKLTWQSDSAGMEYVRGRWDWLHQIGAYLYAVGGTEAIVHVFHVNADYKPPQPKVNRWRIIYQQAEIDETWRMLEGHAKRLAGEGVDRI